MEEREFIGPEHFEAAARRRYAEREIPGFGTIRMQSLSEWEIAEWETEDIADDGKRTGDGMKLMKAGLIVRVLVNCQGERRFHDSMRPKVAAADYAKVNAVFEACREHCGIPRRDVDAIAALRAIQKNCEPGPA